MELLPLIRKAIRYSYLALFFITPFLVSVSSSELFEFPKMLFVYGITSIIGLLWLGNIIISGKVYWRRSWADIPLLLFVLTQLASSVLSLDPHTSWFGYYSRFHGGMLSTLCYALLAWGFIQHARKSWIKDVLMAAVASASIVALFGIGEHFGIDANMWIQDVQNRIFSTLGQPNWLAALMVALLPFTLLWILRPPKSIWPTVINLNLGALLVSYGLTFTLTRNPLPLSGGSLIIFVMFWVIADGLLMTKLSTILERCPWVNKASFILLFFEFVLTILFTKSRSGLLAMIAGLVIFGIGWVIRYPKHLQKNLVSVGLLIGAFVLTLVFWGTYSPAKLSQFILPKTPTGNTAKSVKPLPYAETITDSTDIRRTVWQGAVNLWKKYPLFGSGTETFAYAYYQVRPREHNDSSEWDFLYNKAHNEYLNFLANNGTLGTTAVVLFIVGIIALTVGKKWKPWLLTAVGFSALYGVGFLLFPTAIRGLTTKLLIYPPLLTPLLLITLLAVILWGLIHYAYKIENKPDRYDLAILASTVTIVITNFYGFSVVSVALLFFIFPAFLVIRKQAFSLWEFSFARPVTDPSRLSLTHLLGLTLSLGAGCFALIWVAGYYTGDKNYALAKAYLSAGDIVTASQYIDSAINTNGSEADYYLEKALIASQAAYVISYRDASDSAGLVKSLTESAASSAGEALLKNPVHLNLYKSAARVYITLGTIDPTYNQTALNTLLLARKLSPTDPQLSVNLGLLYDQLGDLAKAEQYFKEAVALKPNYRRAWQYLAQFYEDTKKPEKAKEVYQWILLNIDAKDKTSLERLKALDTPGNTTKDK